MPDPWVQPRVAAVRRPAARSRTWWGRAFVRSLEETAYDAGDLAAGRALARSGRLGPVMVLASMASVVIDPLIAQLKVQPLEDWATFVDELAREAGFVAALEAGELPTELVENADQAGVELLPSSEALETACGCDSWVQPCVHALALLYQLAWRIDEDPYVLLLLRGRTREWLLEEVGSASSRLAWLGSEESAAAAVRARRILALTEHPPSGHGYADSAVAGYDEEISRLL